MIEGVLNQGTRSFSVHRLFYPRYTKEGSLGTSGALIVGSYHEMGPRYFNTQRISENTDLIFSVVQFFFDTITFCPYFFCGVDR